MSKSYAQRRRHLLLCTFFGLFVALLGPGLSKASSGTIVSLTFDDGRQTQYAARAPLDG